MANKCIIYAPLDNNIDGLASYASNPSSSSSFPCSSMGMVYADIGSLSLSPKYGVIPHVSSSYEMENGRATLGFPFMGNYHKTNVVVEAKGSDCSDGFGDNSETINHNANSDEENPNENTVSGKETDSGQSKLCARGHWRPAEDAKLKELVALYGPQNWNLIAEKLEGRSGKHN